MRPLPFRFTAAVVPLLIASFLGTAILSAQNDSPLPENKKAVLSFDFRIQKFLQEFDEDDLNRISESTFEGPFEGIKATDIKRAYGLFSAPEKLQDTNFSTDAEVYPYEFFVRIQFSNVEACEKAHAWIEETSEFVPSEMNGEPCFKPAFEGIAAKSIVVWKVNDSTIEIGTRAYCSRKGRNFFSKKLEEDWNKLPKKAPLRVAVDLMSRKALIREIIESIERQAPRQTLAYFELLAEVDTALVWSDLSQGNLLTLAAFGSDEENAEELKEGLDSLLLLGKMFGGNMLGQFPGFNEDNAEILQGLAAEREGNVVKVVIPKPAGLDGVISNFGDSLTKSKEQRTRFNAIRRLALASLNHESAYMKFPFNTRSESTLSWRCRVLPFTDTGRAIGKQMDLKGNPEDATNVKFTDQMPAIFGADGSNANYRWIKSTVEGFGNITDGSSNTIMLIEDPEGIPWMNDEPLTVDGAIAMVKELPDGEFLVAALYDGSSLKIDKTISEDRLRSMLLPSDGK